MSFIWFYYIMIIHSNCRTHQQLKLRRIKSCCLTFPITCVQILNYHHNLTTHKQYTVRRKYLCTKISTVVFMYRPRNQKAIIRFKIIKRCLLCRTYLFTGASETLEACSRMDGRGDLSGGGSDNLLLGGRTNRR